MQNSRSENCSTDQYPTKMLEPVYHPSMLRIEDMKIQTSENEFEDEEDDEEDDENEDEEVDGGVFKSKKNGLRNGDMPEGPRGDCCVGGGARR